MFSVAKAADSEATQKAPSEQNASVQYASGVEREARATLTEADVMDMDGLATGSRPFLEEQGPDGSTYLCRYVSLDFALLLVHQTFD